MERQEFENGFTENNLIFRSGWTGVPDKQIGEIRDENLESSIQFFRSRFRKIENDLNVLTTRIQNEDNKGSFLLKLQHLKKKIETHDGLGDYHGLNQKIDQLIILIEGFVGESRNKNLKIKKELFNQLEEALQNPSWKESTLVINELHKTWNRTGGVPLEDESIESEFKSKVDDYFKRKQDFFEDKRKLAKHYEKQYLELVQRSKGLVKIHGEERVKELEDLRSKWAEVGPVPAEIYKKLKSDLEKNIRKHPPTDTKEGLLVSVTKRLADRKIREQDIFPILKKIESLKPSGQKETIQVHELKTKLQILQEKHFIESCCEKRFKGYKDKDPKEQVKLKQRILRELLDRDKRELATITLNHEKFNSNSTSFSELMDKKLEDQNSKIKIKESILMELKVKS